MSEQDNDKVQEILDRHAQRRRDLFVTSAKVAVLAPTVALLLKAGTRPAFAYETTPP